MSEVKINYNSDRWKPDFWYATPIHGQDFDKDDVPTHWAIQMLDPEGMEGDMKLACFEAMTYFLAKEICDAHNKVIWSIDRDFDPAMRNKEFKVGDEYER